MMRRQCETALTVMFLGLISLGYLANVAFLGGGSVSTIAAENRRATDFPKWHGEKAKHFFAEYDKYLADRLFKRDQVIRVTNRVLTNDRWYFAFKDADRALFGTDGWVFLGNNYENTLTKHTSPVDTAKLTERKTRMLQHIGVYRQLAEQFGAGFQVLIGPDKPSVYCHKLPSWFLQKPCSQVTEWTENLTTALKDKGFSVTYPQAALLQASEAEQVYYKTDTHWNHSGAAVAYRELMKTLNLKAFDGYRITHGVSRYRGDLAAISGKGVDLPIVNSQSADLTMPSMSIRWKPVNEAEKTVTLLQASNGANPNFAAEMTNTVGVHDKRVLVFCDSFMTALSPFMNATFTHVLYVSRNRSLESWRPLIEAFKPELVIYETVERGL